MRLQLTVLRSILPAGLFCALSTSALAAGGAKHGDAHGADHGSSSGGLPQFDVSMFPSQLFWLVVTFGILYLFFSTKVLPDISSTLENRREHIQDDMDTAQKLKEEAEQAQTDYEKGLEASRLKAHKTLTKTHESIKNKADKEAEKFRELTENEIKALEARIESAKDSIMDDMNVIAAEVAHEAAERVVGISTDIDRVKTVVKSLNDKKKAA